MSKVDFGGITRLHHGIRRGRDHSVTEGGDKPLKYPTIFNMADAAVLTKMDLAAADSARFCQDRLRNGRPARLSQGAAC